MFLLSLWLNLYCLQELSTSSVFHSLFELLTDIPALILGKGEPGTTLQGWVAAQMQYFASLKGHIACNVVCLVTSQPKNGDMVGVEYRAQSCRKITFGSKGRIKAGSAFLHAERCLHPSKQPTVQPRGAAMLRGQH